MVLGETEVNLVLASSTPAGIVNQSFFQIRRYTTLFSLAQRWSINLCYPLYEVQTSTSLLTPFHWAATIKKQGAPLPIRAEFSASRRSVPSIDNCRVEFVTEIFSSEWVHAMQSCRTRPGVSSASPASPKNSFLRAAIFVSPCCRNSWKPLSG
jgi:hypothetical protein